MSNEFMDDELKNIVENIINGVGGEKFDDHKTIDEPLEGLEDIFGDVNENKEFWEELAFDLDNYQLTLFDDLLEDVEGVEPYYAPIDVENDAQLTLSVTQVIEYSHKAVIPNGANMTEEQFEELEKRVTQAVQPLIKSFLEDTKVSFELDGIDYDNAYSSVRFTCTHFE